MKKIKIIISLTSVILLLGILVICIVNIVKDPSDFWKMSIGQALTPTVAIVIAFFATQVKTDERKAKDAMANVVVKVQEIVSDPTFWTFNECDTELIKKRTGMTNRGMSNRIEALKKYSEKLGSIEEVTYIQKQFSEYKDYLSEHIEDAEYLNKSENQLKKYATNIGSKCDDILVNLYT